MRPFALLLTTTCVLLFGAARPSTAHPRVEVRAQLAACGDRVLIEWSGLPASVHEVELEVSLGGSRWRRISPELEARDGRYEWRAPEWATGDARIRLRMGGDGFERAELVAAALTLAEHDALQRPGADAVDGWWALSTEPGPDAPGVTAPSLAATESSELADTDERSLTCASDQRGPLCRIAHARASDRPGTPRRSRTPKRVPLRN